MRPPLLACAVLIAVLTGGGLGRGALAQPEAPPPAIEVPVGTFVQLDGRVSDAEWEGAASVDLNTEGARLRFLQRRGTLLLALTSPAPWPEGASLWLAFRPDDGQKNAGLFEDGAVHVDFEPREHNRPHVLALRNVKGREVPLDALVAARATADAPYSAFEIALPLTALGIHADDGPALRFALLWHRGALAPRLVWPATLSLEAPPQQPPPGLQSSAAWARLGGWQDVGQGGAFPRLEWEAWQAQDIALTEKGAKAHQAARAVLADPETPKRDGAILKAVRDNFDAIAKEERLTPHDLLTLARVLRFLNRQDEALALLDGIGSHALWRSSPTLLYERALLEEAADRWREAATTWRALAPRSQAGLRQRYEVRATRAEKRASAFELETARRREDAQRAALPLVLLRTTRGDVLIQLFADDVPKATAHFLDLAGCEKEGERGFYDGTCFHRVLGGYLAQGGDPTSRDHCEAAGSGSGPTSIDIEANERHGFWRGAVGFAHGMALVNGSQFFILTGSRPGLGDDSFTCFGHVLSGMDVVDRLEQGDRLLEVRVLSLKGGGK